MGERNKNRKWFPGVKKRLVAGSVLLATVVVLVCLFLFGNKERTGALSPVKQNTVTASAKHYDTGSKAATQVPETTQKKEPIKNAEPIIRRGVPRQKPFDTVTKDSARTVSAKAAPDASVPGKDTVPKAPAEGFDTAKSGNAVLSPESPSGNCAGDTLAPWVYPEPSGGLHRGTVSITFKTNKPCRISWRFEPDTEWHSWSGEPVTVERTATIAFKAVDGCGRAMADRLEYYEITSEQTAGLCPSDMELVKIGATRFCIDRYEWPNRKGVVPQSYVSQYQARDSCSVAGKRLCSSEEWSLACSGPYSWNYPYGQEYERYACVTHDTTPRPSGSKPECRAFFGVFDMSGNLLEWTSTASKENRQFFNVMGGFWQSGPRSGCFDIRYSYFPQNRHNPVGFRCCKETAPAEK